MPRLAKTDAEHRLHSTVSQVGRSKPVQTASVYAGGRPKIPQHLDKLARAEFKRVCQILEHRKTLTEGDRLTIAVLAEVYSRWCTAKAELGTAYTTTVTITDKKGNVITTIKSNPLVKVVEVAETKLLALSKSLGLTPGDRDKVRPTQLDPPTEAELSTEELYMRSIEEKSQPRIIPMPPPKDEEEEL
jgi:P27 family predicted phage terminase small subunit